MTLRLHALSYLSPADKALMPAIARVHFAAWLTNPLFSTVYYGPPSTHPAITAAFLARHSDALETDPNIRMALVIDDQLSEEEDVEERFRDQGKVIGGIKFAIKDPAADDSSTAGARTWPEGTNVELATNSWEQLRAGRKAQTELLGKHVLVDVLFTDPRHQKRGAGKMLMKHAVAEADKLGLPCYLEASLDGRKLYESVGFREIENATIWLDMERFADGGDKGVEFSRQKGGAVAVENGWYPQVPMVRPVGGSPAP